MSLQTYDVNLPQAGIVFENQDIYTSSWPGELTSGLENLGGSPVKYGMNVKNYGASPLPPLPDRYRIAHVFVPDIQPGDVIDVKTGFEITNNLNYFVEISAQLYITPNSSGAPWSDPDDTTISRNPGYNCGPHDGQHHGMWDKSITFTVPENFTPGDYYVALYAYAGGSSLSQAGDKITVENNCTDLSVIRTRKAG